MINAQLAAGEKRGSEMMGVKDLAGTAYLEAGKDKGCAVCNGALLMGFGAKKEAE